MGSRYGGAVDMRGLTGVLAWLRRRWTRGRLGAKRRLAVSELCGLRDAVLEVARDGAVITGNPAAAALFGWPPRADGTPPKGMRLEALFAVDLSDTGVPHPLSCAMTVAWIRGYGRETPAFPYGARVLAQRGAVRRPVSVSVLRRDAQGTVLVVSDDADKQEIARLRTQEERLSLGNTMARVGTWDWNIRTDALHWSGEAFRLFGQEPGTLKPTRTLVRFMLSEEDAERVEAAEQRCLAGAAPYDEVFRVVWNDGTALWLRETGDVVRDGSGRPYRFIGVVRDVTEEKKQEAAILHQAYHDPLTGLSNRAWFRIVMSEALVRARRTGSLLAVAFMDLDGFKPVNDCYGHAVGDQVLVRIGQRLQDCVRATDTVARLGGDEFAFLLENLSDLDGALVVAEKSLVAVQEPMEISGEIHRVSASLGVIVTAPLPSVSGSSARGDGADEALAGSDSAGQGRDVDRLLDQADQAMYEAKRAGPGSLRVYQTP